MAEKIDRKEELKKLKDEVNTDFTDLPEDRLNELTKMGL